MHEMPSTNISPKCAYIGGVASQLCRLIDKFSFLDCCLQQATATAAGGDDSLLCGVREVRCVLGGFACFSASH